MGRGWTYKYQGDTRRWGKGPLDVKCEMDLHDGSRDTRPGLFGGEIK